MHKIALILLSTTLMASVAYAGGGIFGGGKHRTANVNGVYAIGVHVCSSLECPPVRIVAGTCDGANMQKRYGVCVCEKGYVAKGDNCELCEDGTYSDGMTGCQPCPDEHAATCNSSGVTQTCQTGYYLNENTCDLISCDEFEGTDITYSGGIAGKANDGTTDCHCLGGNRWDNDTKACTTICNDHTTNQCGLGYYCQFSPYDCDDNKGGNPNGVCTPVGSGTPLKDGAYLKGPETDWWSAYSWCIGNGMDLVTSSIAGHSLSSYYENYDGNGDLYTYFGQDIYFWTGHDYGDSCNVWLVNAVSLGEDVIVGSHNYNYYAVCE